MARAQSLIQRIAHPEKLQRKGNIAENWKTFKHVWTNYAIITNLDKQSEQYRVALFLHCIGTEALKIYNGMSFTEEERGNLEAIMNKFDEFTIGEINETYERYVFNSRNQGEDECIDAYVAILRTIARTCNFCDCLKDSLIRDRIVFGVKSDQTRKKLLQEGKLSLKKCIDLCRSAEVTITQMKTISDHVASEEVNRVKITKQTNARRITGNDTTKISCKFCAGRHPQRKESCPAWGKECLKCGGKNHFVRACRKTGGGQRVKVYRTAEEESRERESDTETSDIEYLGSVAVYAGNICVVEPSDEIYPREIYPEMLIDDKPVEFQVDCGASINILPDEFVGKEEISPTAKTLIMWNKTEVKPKGTVRLVIKNPKTRKRFSLEFVFVKECLTPLIGARAAQQMKLITIHKDNFVSRTVTKRKNPSVSQLSTVEEIVKQYPQVFGSQLGRFPGKVKLEVDEKVKPVITPTRRVPTALREKFKDELNRLEALGVIAKVDEPTPWVSSVVVTTKKSGSLRVCIDPKPLNAALKRERYPLPVLDDLLPELAEAKVFSTVDLRAGYWHCILDEGSSILTTFATPYGRYKWLRLPFGLSVSSEIFQKRVHQILDQLDGILDITDDILVYGVGATEEDANADHDRKLKCLLERCKERGVTLNPSKLKLRMKEVTYMGHLLTKDGLKIDPEKVKAVKEMPRPADVEAVQRLDGFVNYLAKFLPKLADVMEPIRRLTRKDTEWAWTEEQEKTFQDVKKLVTHAPILSYYKPNGDLGIQCDASQKGLGATLLQQGKPVVYISRALTETDQRYAQIEKEMLAIVYSLEKLNQYVFGRRVKVQTDHKPLESILQKPLASAPRRLQGMMMRLQKYDVEVRYQPGKTMHIADM